MREIFFKYLLIGFGFALTVSASAQSAYVYLENKGQWPKQVLAASTLENGQLWIERDRLLFHFWDLSEWRERHGKDYKDGPKPLVKGQVYEVRFIGANPYSSWHANKARTERYNYFLGNDPTHWAGNVGAYEQFNIQDVYAGIDARFYSSEFFLKYDFIAAPGANPSEIKLKYQGQDQLKLADGRLQIYTQVGQIIEQAPVAYQMVKGHKKMVKCQYKLEDQQISFEFPDGYQLDEVLIIDPELIFSTYSGSFSDNFGYTATYDHQGFLYSGSSAFGQGYPTTLGAYQEIWAGGDGSQYNNGTDIAITKYDSSGTAIIYSTFLGGSNDELPHSLITDEEGRLFVYGTSSSPDFPTSANAYDRSFNGGTPVSPWGVGVDFVNGSDIVIASLSADGSALLGATFLGGSGNDGLNTAPELKFNYADEMRGEIILDHKGQVYVVSSTQSADFPVVDALQTALLGSQDGCITLLNKDLSAIYWSSYLGGDRNDAAYSMALDENDHIYICGGTTSTDMPVSANAYQNAFQGGRADGFIWNISQDGSSLTAASYLGSAAYDQLYFIELDNENQVYLFGQTQAADSTFIHNAEYGTPNSGMLVANLNDRLSLLDWSTVFGTGSGKPNLSPTAFLVDVCHNIYLSGWGGTTNMISNVQTDDVFGMEVSPDAFQKTTDGSDFYILVLQDDANLLEYASFFGGPKSSEHVDGGTSRFDSKGIIYQSVCAGCRGNSDFPIYPDNAYSAKNNSPNCNNAVFKFDFQRPLTIADFDAPKLLCDQGEMSFVNKSRNATAFVWTFGDGTQSTEVHPSHEYTSPGVYEVKLMASNPLSCNIVDSVIFYVERIDIGLISNEDIDYCQPPQTVVLNAESSLTPVAFHWSDKPDFSNMLNASTDDPSMVKESSQPGVFYIKASHRGCDAIDSVHIDFLSAYAQLEKSITACSGDTVVLAVLNSLPSLYYNWSPADDILFGQGEAVVKVAPNKTTSYKVSIDTLACSVSDSIEVKLSNLADKTIEAWANPETITSSEVSVLQVLPLGYFYEWFDEDGVLIASGSNLHTLEVSPDKTTIYKVNVVEGRCRRSTEVQVTVFDYVCGPPNIYVPNAFTPNNDGLNDLLLVRGDYISSLTFSIFDRWGALVFETSQQEVGWDGIYRGEAVDQAVFVYELEATCPDGQTYYEKGNITLIR